MIRAELERRPFLVLSLGLILGLTLILHPFHLILLLPLPWVLRDLRSRTVFVISFVAGVLLGPGQPAILDRDQFVSGDWSIVSMPDWKPPEQACEVRQGNAKLMLFYAGPIALCPGSTIRFNGLARPPTAGSEASYRLRGLNGQVKAISTSLQVVGEASILHRLAYSWRLQFLEFTAANLSPSAAAITDSMCFHVDGFLSEQSRENVRNSGSTHLIAASGLQAVLLGQVLLWLFSFLPVPRWAQLCVLALVLGLYVIATGSSPSITRAVLMSLIANSAFLVRREPDWLTGLAVSSIFYLVLDPDGVYRPGFQITFIAVLFISLFQGYVKWRPGAEAAIARFAIRSLRTSLLAYVVITPLLAQVFGAISLVMAPVGLLLLVTAVPVVIVSMAAFPVALIWPALGGSIIKSIEPLTGFLYSGLDAFGGPAAAVQTPPFSPYWLALYYLLLVLLWRPRLRPA